MLHQGLDVLAQHLGRAGGHGGRQVGVTDDQHAVLHDFLAGLGQLAVPARLGGEVDDDRAGAHGLDHLLGDQAWRRTPWDQGGGDDRIGLSDARRDQLRLAALVVVAHLARVATGRLRLGLLLIGHLDLEEGPAQ